MVNVLEMILHYVPDNPEDLIHRGSPAEVFEGLQDREDERRFGAGVQRDACEAGDVGHAGAPRVAQQGDLVEVDAETGHAAKHSGCGMRETGCGSYRAQVPFGGSRETFSRAPAGQCAAPMNGQDVLSLPVVCSVNRDDLVANVVAKRRQRLFRRLWPPFRP